MSMICFQKKGNFPIENAETEVLLKNNLQSPAEEINMVKLFNFNLKNIVYLWRRNFYT